MDIKNLSKYYKRTQNSNLSFSNNLQLERIDSIIDDKYDLIQFLFKEMHWTSLRNLGQMLTNESIGLIYQLLTVKENLYDTKSSFSPSNPSWIDQIKANEKAMSLIRTNDSKLHDALLNERWWLLEEIVQEHYSEQAEKIDDITSKLIGLISKALLSILHGEINATVVAWKDRNETDTLWINHYMIEEKKTVLDDIKKEVNNCVKDVESKIFGIYQHIVKENRKVNGLLNEAISLLHWASAKLVDIGDIQNLLNDYIKLLQANNKNSFSEQVGKQNAYLGSCARKVIGSVISTFRLVFDIAWEYENPLLDDIKSMVFRNNLPDGKNVAIHNLEKIEENTFVEVAGFIQEVDTFRTSRGALICRAKLYDPSSKKSVWVATLYSHLEHIGIDINTYMVVHGELYHQSNLANKERAIHIDRIEQSNSSQVSWKAAFLYQSSPYYQVWYNGMNIEYSLTQHYHQYEDRKFIVEKTGASEMIFQPLYRSELYKQQRKEKYNSLKLK